MPSQHDTKMCGIDVKGWLCNIDEPGEWEGEIVLQMHIPSTPDDKGLMFSVEAIKMNESFISSKEIFLVLKSVNDRNHARGSESGFKNIPL